MSRGQVTYFDRIHQPRDKQSWQQHGLVVTDRIATIGTPWANASRAVFSPAWVYAKRRTLQQFDCGAIRTTIVFDGLVQIVGLTFLPAETTTCISGNSATASRIAPLHILQAVYKCSHGSIDQGLVG